MQKKKVKFKYKKKKKKKNIKVFLLVQELCSVSLTYYGQIHKSIMHQSFVVPAPTGPGDSGAYTFQFAKSC